MKRTTSRRVAACGGWYLLLAAQIPVPARADANQIDVIEFFHPLLGHYFMSAGANEIASLDAGGAGGNWVRTGQSFKAWKTIETAPDTAFPVCRFYSQERNSHFYTANPTECEKVKTTDPGWIYEGIPFYIERPADGQCATGIPVMRTYNNRYAENDSNHRYATLASIIDEMTGLGWVAEGPRMCTRDALNNGGVNPQQVSTPVRTDTAETLTAGDGARITIPIGAVAPTPSGATGSATITMAIDTTAHIALPEGGSLGSRVYRLTPGGHVFQQNVTLTLPLTVDPQGQEVQIYTQREDGSLENLRGYYDAATNGVTTQTLHFSPFWTVLGGVPHSTCLQIDNSFASPYNAKNFCVAAVNSLADPTIPVSPDAGGMVSGPHDVVYGFAKVAWDLPAGNYDICVESWNRDTQLSLPTFRGSFVYPGINVSTIMGSAGSWGDGCATRLSVGQLMTPVNPNPCGCGATTPTPGGTGTPLEISLNWKAQPGVDLDLHVIEPGGREIYYHDPVSPSGGSLDWDNACANYQNGRTENISWSSPPSGSYRILVDYYGRCSGDSSSSVLFQVNVKSGGTTKSYSGDIADGATLEVANIDYAGMTLSYSGVATYDGQPATMNLTINGTAVTGTLDKPGVCQPNIRLTETNLVLTGVLTGAWGRGQTGTITGDWTGGDSVCGTQLTQAEGYPQAGTFTITRDGNIVRLLRTGTAPLPSGWTYDFND